MALFIGKVVGTKMQKTAKVEVTRMFLHPQVLKVNPFTRPGKLCFLCGSLLQHVYCNYARIIINEWMCTGPMLASCRCTYGYTN